MQNKSVMVVEDNSGIREALVDLLEGEGYQVLSAQNGRHALELLGDAQPAVIVLDIAMPEMDGVALHDQLQKAARLSSIPIVVVTANRQEAEDHGMKVEAWLHKPFDIDHLFSLIKSCTNRQPC